MKTLNELGYLLLVILGIPISIMIGSLIAVIIKTGKLNGKILKEDHNFGSFIAILIYILTLALIFINL